MKRNILPLILTNKSSKTNLQKNLSKVNLDFSKINSFGKKFAQLKQDYINIKTMKKSISQNQYQEKLLNNDDENAKKNLYLEEAVYGADYIAKFKKIKLNLYKNRYIKKGRNNLFQNKLDQNNNNEKAPSLMFENDILLDDEKYLLEKNFYYNEIKPKNELNYDIEENNEVDSEDEIELEPERYRNKEIQSVEQSERTKKVNIRKNVLYLTELQNTKNPLEFPLPIKNKRSINDQININNIKQIKLSEDTQKYKNPFIFKKYSSLNNISHFHKIYRSFKNICRKHYAKGDSPSYAFIKSCEREKIVCNPLGLIKRWGDEGSLDINNQHTGDRYVNCLSSSLKYVKHINTLEMSKNNLTNVSMEKLFDNIKQNDNLVKNLLKLNLSFNNIKEKGISNIINFIEDKSCQLEDINLEGNNLGDNNINNLCMSISECLCNRLNTINLGKNKITKNSEQGLLALTSKCSELAVLILRNNQINNLLAYKIVLNLEKLYSLKMLDFSWNLIGDHLVYPILQRKEKDKNSNPVSELLALDKQNLKLIQSKISRNKESYKKRIFKTNNKYEENIISDDVRYTCYTRCIGCGKVIDIGKLCSNLSNMHIRIRNGLDMIKCYHRSKDGKNCDYYNCLRLKFRYGTELFNSKLTRLSTSKNFNIPLLTTTSLKENLLELSKYYHDSNKKLDIESFKKNHQLEFWNVMWYFELNNIDISFILPYIKVEDVNLSEIYNLNNYKDKIAENHKVNIVSDNNNLEIEKSNLKDKYFEDELCIQDVYQFAFFKNSGMVSYKNIFSYEDNINYNELPLIFKNTELEIEDEDEDHTLTRSHTSNYLKNINDIRSSNINYTDYNDINNSFGTNTPLTKKYTNYINFLSQSAKKQIIPTLVNSSSSPSLLNNTSANKNLQNSNNYEISKKNTLTGINFIN